MTPSRPALAVAQDTPHRAVRPAAPAGAPGKRHSPAHGCRARPRPVHPRPGSRPARAAACRLRRRRPRHRRVERPRRPDDRHDGDGCEAGRCRLRAGLHLRCLRRRRSSRSAPRRSSSMSGAATFNIDPADLERAIDETLKAGELTPRAVMPVDLFGLPADYAAIAAVAARHGLTVLADAAQSVRRRLRQQARRRAGADQRHQLLSDQAARLLWRRRRHPRRRCRPRRAGAHDPLARPRWRPATRPMCSASPDGWTRCRRRSCWPSSRSSTRNWCAVVSSPRATPKRLPTR